MEKTEFDSLVKQLKAAGLNEEQIMETLYETFQEGKMDRQDLEACANWLGYELTDEFKNDPTPDPIATGGEGGISKEQAEAAKEIAPGESKEEFKAEIEGDGNAPAPTDNEPAPEEPKEEKEPEEPKAEPEKSKPEETDEDKEFAEVAKKLHW